MHSRALLPRISCLALSFIIFAPLVASAAVLPVEDGLVIWLDAAQLDPGLNNNNNITWTDATGTAGVGDGVSQNATNWQGGPTFRLNQVNQRPGVDFGGGGAYWYQGPIGLSGQAEFTAFAVGYHRDAGDDRQRLMQFGDIDNGSGDGTGGASVALNPWNNGQEGVDSAGFRYNNGWSTADNARWDDWEASISTWQYETTDTYNTGRYDKNGITYPTNSNNAGGTINLVDEGYQVGVGMDGSGDRKDWLKGAVGEILLYNRALSADEIAQVGAYLGDKWGVSNQYAPLTSAAATLNYDAADPATTSDRAPELQGFSATDGRHDLILGSGVTSNGKVLSFDGGPNSYAHFAGPGDVVNPQGSQSNDDFEALYTNPSNESASFELWFRPTDLSGNEILFELGGTTDGSAMVLSDEILSYTAKDDGNQSTAQADLSTAAINNLIQAVTVFDDSDDELRLYIDGQLIDNQAYTGDDWSGGDKWGLGYLADAMGGNLSGYDSFVGDIGAFRFYQTALSDADVQSLFDAMQPVPEPSSILIGIIGLTLLWYARRRELNQVEG